MPNQVLIISADVSFRSTVAGLLEKAGLRVEAGEAHLLDAPEGGMAAQLLLVDLNGSPTEALDHGRTFRRIARSAPLPVVYLIDDPGEATFILSEPGGERNVVLPRSIDPASLISTVKSLVSTSFQANSLRALDSRIQEIEAERDEFKAISSRTVSLLESITDGFYSLDREWRFTYFNAAAERISGRSRDELLGHSLWEMFPESVHSPAYGYYHQAIRHQVPITFETFYEPLGIWLEINVYPSPEGLSAYYRNITERKRAEATFSSYAAQQTAIALVGERALAGAPVLELLEETTQYVAHTLDVEYASVFALQPEAGDLLLVAGTGWDDEVIGQAKMPSGAGSRFGYLVGQQAPLIVDDLAAETRFVVEPLLLENGVVSDLAVIIQEQGRPYGVLAAHATGSRPFTQQELTFVQSIANTLAAAIQRRQLEAHLLQSQTTLARAQEITGIGSWSVEPTTGAVYWSDQMYRIFGVRPEEFSPSLWSILSRVHPEDRQRASAFISDSPLGGVEHHLDQRIVMDDGEVRWIRIQAERGVDPDSSLVRLVGTVLDITERKRAEEALRESQERYQVLFDRSPIPKVLYDEATLRFLAVNEAAVEFYGYEREEFLRMTLMDLWSPAAMQELRDTQNLAAQISAKVHHVKKDGTPAEVEIVTQRVFLGGRPARIILTQDITERVQLEGQLRQAQKMEAVGRLAGGVAHDFNNMLAVIAGYSELLLHLTDAEDRRDLRLPLQEIQKASERAARLTRQLLAFSRKQVLTPKVLDLGGLVVDFERMLSRLIGEDIEVAVRIAPELHQVKADPGQLEQVLLNLVVNSRDAMPTGGKITIEVRNAQLGGEYGKKHRLATPGDYVLLAVTDTGCGMTPETLEHAFEPFFTTKSAEHGTGLGLATVFGIVQQSDGHVDVYSEVGIGTTFKIYLPRIYRDVELAELPQPACPTGEARVLLVEDEDMVRALVQEVLTMYGYTVMAAANGQEALQIVEQLAPDIDLLLTDVVMPGGVGGRQLAEALRSQRPDLKVLYMSGYTDDAVVRHGIIEADTAFIQKPFTPLALARKVREVLG